MKYLLFGIKLRQFRRWQKVSTATLAKNFGMTTKQMVQVMEAQHVPNGVTALLIQEQTEGFVSSHDLQTWVDEAFVRSLLGGNLADEE
jgi:hypothetical protein